MPEALGLLARIGLALAGRARARLTAVLGIATGKDTLLRLVKTLPEPDVGAVETLGVDDFAFRRGRHYDTVPIDMATPAPLHLFDGREGRDLAAWLRRRPEVRAICRDPSSGYGEGCRQGAPQAPQVADRFHLWQNLFQAVEKAVNALRPHLAEPFPQPEPDGLEAESDIMRPHPELKIVARLTDQHAAVHELWAQGLSKAAISRQFGLHQATVCELRQRHDGRGTDSENLAACSPRRPLHRLPPPPLERSNPQRNPALPGDPATRLPRRRTGRPTAPATLPDTPRPHAGTRPQAPSVREVTAWITAHPDHPNGADADKLAGLRSRNADLDRLAGHVRAFAVMLTHREGDRLDAWIHTVETDSLTSVASFARNLRRDIDAVRNALTLPYSSGAVEGNINRLKMLKRQMSGRAGLDLLRKRVLLTR